MASKTITMSVTGGQKLGPYLQKLAARIGKGGTVSVGFLEGATYPAAKPKRAKKGRRQRAAQPSGAPPLSVAQVAFWNNFGTSRARARPFFSNTVTAQSPTWGGKLATALKSSNMDSEKALAKLGTDIKDNLVKSIKDWPADNSRFTEAMKGFNKGLIDSAVMLRSVDFVVKP